MKKYWIAARPFTLPASIVPVLIGTACAKLIFNDLQIDWLNFVLVMVGCCLSQLISNMANDLSDFDSGLDTKENVRRYNALIAGDLTSKQVFMSVVYSGIVCLLIGAYLALVAGWPILLLAVVGGICAIEYTAPPLKFKHRAMGDIVVLLTFGLGMVYGSYLVQVHGEPKTIALSATNLLRVLIYAIPSASLVVAILHTNNHMDRERDRAGGAKTLANVLTFGTSKKVLLSMIIGPYIFLLIGVLTQSMTWFVLLAVLSFPQLLNVVNRIRSDNYQMMVPKVAKLNGQFGILVAAGIAVQIYLNHRSRTG